MSWLKVSRRNAFLAIAGRMFAWPSAGPVARPRDGSVAYRYTARVLESVTGISIRRRQIVFRAQQK